MRMFHRLFQGQLNQMDKTHHKRTWEAAIGLQLDRSLKEFPSLDGKLLSALHLRSKILFTLPQHEFHLHGARYRFCTGILQVPLAFYLLLPTHLYEKFSTCVAFIFCKRHYGQEPSTSHGTSQVCYRHDNHADHIGTPGSKSEAADLLKVS